jgi:inhibitor of cysteine peptidase
VYENGDLVLLQPSSVFYAQNVTQISCYTMVVSVNMSNGQNKITSVLTGPSSTIYVSTNNIYVVYTDYLQYYADGIPGDVFTGGVIAPGNVEQQGPNSTIFRVSYSSGVVQVEAAGSVPGTVLNQFSMDEYDGYFRVATSRTATIDGTATMSDDIYVLDQSMGQVSALKNIAPGENIYAVRFVGDIGYVVTFEQIDPLFVISFQDMTEPVILSSLKVSGYSDYLYPLSNGYLIGVGKDAVPSSTGNFAWYLGLKLSLFQVFDNGTSTQVSTYLIGDRGTDSPVLTDHLAFTFDSTRNIMVIPVLLAKVSGNQTYSPSSPPPYGDYVWQGVYVFNVTESGFTLLGKVSQYPAGQNYGDSPMSNLQVDRSVLIGDYLYTISQGEVMVSGLSSFATLATIPLA